MIQNLKDSRYINQLRSHICDHTVLMDVTQSYEGPPIKRYFIVYPGSFKGVVFEGTPKIPSKYSANREIFLVVPAFGK